ncbi:MAG: lamin tail domain-containing protein [bacterium]
MRLKHILSIIILMLTFISVNTQFINAQTIDDNNIQKSNLDTDDIPEFSVTRGFYDSSFDVTISAETAGAKIKYTLDGSDPIGSPTALHQNAPATVHVDPESTTGNRDKTPGVVLRACTLFPDNSLSESVTHTYLFINKVPTLSPEGVKPGPGWPDPGFNQQYIDYGMSQTVLNDSRYKNVIDDALISVPTFSLVTDLDNLFDPSTGIYMNALESGDTWECPASVELLNPDGSEGFQINCGIRIRGGWSAHGDNPKHAFRLFFREEYGKKNLDYPLFENEGVDEFDKMDIRTSQNYAWSYPGHLGQYNIMIRDVFSRDLQAQTGNQFTRSRAYHLYINGVYWGLFQTQERSEARFAASYYGGTVEDYDVIKTNGTSNIEATDGTLDAWKDVWNLCRSGFTGNKNYFKVQGKNEDGLRNTSYDVLVDVDNLIDYMMIIFYGGNYDSPCSKFASNKGPNNFFAIYNRNGKEGFKFFVHDAEHSIRTTPGEGDGIGLYENRVNIGILTDGFKMTVSDFNKFHPQWLHFKLSDNDEYKLLFADHVYKHFFNQGCMTPAKVTSLFEKRTEEIDMAIIGESARWGDLYSNPPRTKDDDWQPAIDDIIDNYFPLRTGIVLNQLKQVDLYPDIDPPVYKNNNLTVTESLLEVGSGYILKLTNPNTAKGSIIFTTDGLDPRIIGGAAAASAQDGGDEIDITINSTTVVKARILNGTTWSAIHELILFVDDNDANLKLTEIHYHPLAEDTIDDDEYEFLELKNIGNAPLNLSGAYFSDAVIFTFPESTILNPNEFFVIGANREMFNDLYSFYPSGEYAGRLDNGGEPITLCQASGDTVFSITYDDTIPWPEACDGTGVSLVPVDINPTGNLNDPVNWRTSYAVNGSPGRDDVFSSVEDPTDAIPNEYQLSQNYPNPFNPTTVISYQLPVFGKVSLIVYDVLGREIATLVDEFQCAGIHHSTFNTLHYSLASGVYFYRLQAGGTIITKKMALLK